MRHHWPLLDLPWSRHWWTASSSLGAEAANEYQAIADIASRTFGAEDQRVLDSRSGRGLALTRLGRFAEAEEELRAVHDVSARVLGPGHDTTMTSRHLRAIALLGLGGWLRPRPRTDSYWVPGPANSVQRI